MKRACIAAAFVAALPAGAETDAHATWERERLLQPAAVERDAADAAWADAVRAQLLRNLADVPPATLAGGTLTARDLVGNSFRVHRHEAGLNFTEVPPEGLVPAWLQQALAQRIAALSIPATAAPVLPRDLWFARRDGEAPAHAWASPVLWSGPAVRDGAASYRSEGDGTRIRLAIGDPSALLALARARGAAVRVTLDAGARALAWDEPLPMRLVLTLPVWIVTPQELVPATLSALRTGPPCEGGHLELRIAGRREPPVWAVLFLPDEATARAARVRRLPAVAPDPAGTTASQVSRLELSWPDLLLPTVELTARRYVDVWGTQALLAARKPEEAVALSAAGSPECAPR